MTVLFHILNVEHCNCAMRIGKRRERYLEFLWFLVRKDCGISRVSLEII